MILLEALKTNYTNIIPYFDKPELALKCIDYDISMLNLLINEDKTNLFSSSYFKNYNKFLKFYNDVLKKNEQQVLNPSINYSEEIEPYINDPNILYIEKNQYDLYDFNILLFYFDNQLDIWMILFKSIESFIKTIGELTNLSIANSENNLINLNNSV